MKPIAVACNKLKPFEKHLYLDKTGTQLEMLLKWLFLFQAKVIGLHPLVRPYVRGCVEEKRITLIQGGRVHEGSAPSDKRVNKLMSESAGLCKPDPINKAAEYIKGKTPMYTPLGADSYMVCIHIHIIAIVALVFPKYICKRVNSEHNRVW